MNFIKTFLRRALLAFALIACGSHALAAPTYRVQIDTSALAGQSGWLDFLVLGLGGASPATAQLSGFSGDFDTATQLFAGDAGGTLAGGITLGNTTAWNEFAQWTHFGGLLSLNVDLDLPTAAGAGSTLSIALLDDQFNYLAFAGDLVTFELLPGADVVATSFSPLASVTVAAAVPEPATAALMLLALPALWLSRRRR